MAAPVKNLGGSIVGPPILTTWGPKRLDIFHCGTQLGLYHQWRKENYSGAFKPGGSSWERLSETGHTSISGVCWGEGKIDLFGVRAQKNTLDHKWYRGDGGWRNWESLNPCEYGGSTKINTEVAGDISVVTWDRDKPNMIVLWRGSDSALHYMTWNDDEKVKKWWQLTWTEPGKVFIGSPKAVCWQWGGPGDYRVDVFARRSDNHLLHTNWKVKDGPKGTKFDQFLTWEDLGGPIMDDPEVVQCTWYEKDAQGAPAPRHSINIFARDTENNVIRRRWLSILDGWAPRDRWEATGLQAATPPGAVAWTSSSIGNVAVAALGVDQALHFAKQDGSRPWENDPSDPKSQSWTFLLVDEGGVPFTHRPVVYHPRADEDKTGDDPVEIYIRARDASVKQILVDIKPKAN